MLTNEQAKRKWAHLTPNCLPHRKFNLFEIMGACACVKAFDFAFYWYALIVVIVVWDLMVFYGHNLGQKMDIFEPYRNPPKEEDK
jgi:hypothetical protein